MREIPNYEDYYKVTTCGKVWSNRSQKYLKPAIIKGYEKVLLYKTVNGKSQRKQLFVHRLVALTYLTKVEGKNLNEELVKFGYAWVYRKYCDRSFCKDWLEFEKTASENKIGLWADKSPLPPWEWRKLN